MRAIPPWSLHKGSHIESTARHTPLAHVVPVRAPVPSLQMHWLGVQSVALAHVSAGFVLDPPSGPAASPVTAGFPGPLAVDVPPSASPIEPAPPDEQAASALAVSVAAIDAESLRREGRQSERKLMAPRGASRVPRVTRTIPRHPHTSVHDG